MQSVLDLTAEHWPQVVIAAFNGDAPLSIAFYVTSGPTLVGTDLDGDQLAKLAELGARLDFDLYDFVPDRG